MSLHKLVAYGLLMTGLFTGFGLPAIAHDDDHPPSEAQVEFAKETSELLLATLFAALLQEFAETTVDNVEQGKRSISLIFNNRNKDMRLVGTWQPLQNTNRPRDAFEHEAHQKALLGQDFARPERVDGAWYYRRSVALSNFSEKCSFCHTNFPTGGSTDMVGALMLRVPIQ